MTKISFIYTENGFIPEHPQDQVEEKVLICHHECYGWEYTAIPVWICIHPGDPTILSCKWKAIDKSGNQRDVKNGGRTCLSERTVG